jgi:hypothetical protein
VWKYTEKFTGVKKGHLLALEEPRSERINNRAIRVIKCKCDCGIEKDIIFTPWHNGSTVTCGCRMKHRKHGCCKTRIYQEHKRMKDRCNATTGMHYKNYGARGIKMCKEWQDDFLNFYNWAMANGYRDDLSIERIDVNGDYCPENCTWIPTSEQGENKTTSVKITYNEETHTVGKWAKIFGIPDHKLRDRLTKRKMTFEEALKDLNIIWEGRNERNNC